MQKTKRRWLALLGALLLLGGCAPDGTREAAAPAPVPTVAPTPEPVGMEKVFGKEIRVACVAADFLFAQGVQAEAERYGIPLALLEESEDTAGFDAQIVFDTGAPMEAPALPTVLYTEGPGEAAEGLYILAYNKAAETEAALEAMFSYTSHEAPVRILGLFEHEAAAAHAAYAQMQSDGKLQSKGCYFKEPPAGSDGAPVDESFPDAHSWLLDTLGGITVGVLDTVYAENPALALEGFAALREAARNDAVEICTAGLDVALIAAMQDEHFLMGTAVGANGYAAGRLALRMALCALAGETVEAQTELAPVRIASEDVFALQKEGVTGLAEVLTALDDSTEDMYRPGFLAELALHAEAAAP